MFAPTTTQTLRHLQRGSSAPSFFPLLPPSLSLHTLFMRPLLCLRTQYVSVFRFRINQPNTFAAISSLSLSRTPSQTRTTPPSSTATRTTPPLIRATRCHATSTPSRSSRLSTSLQQGTKMSPYEEVLKGKYPGKLHAKRVAEYIRSKVPDATTGVIYLEGGKTRMIEDCDQEEHFRYTSLP